MRERLSEGVSCRLSDSQRGFSVTFTLQANTEVIRLNWVVQ